MKNRESFQRPNRTENKVPNTETLEEKKKRINPEKLNTVRVLLTQPISSIDINEHTDIKKIAFIRSVWSEKNSKSNNSGQLMPVGGMIQDKDYKYSETEEELITATATRELLEETHLRSFGIKIIPVKQSYQFILWKKEVERHTAFASARLFSNRFDKPYPINENEDKIAGFLYLDYHQLKSLLKNNNIPILDKQKTILDSLDSILKNRENKGTKANTVEIKSVKYNIMSDMGLQEYNKKVTVIKTLLRFGKIKIPKEAIIRNNIEKWSENKSSNFNKLKKIESLWSDIIIKNELDWKDVKEALMIDNYEEYLNYLESEKEKRSPKQEKKNYLLPTIYLLYPLFFGSDPKISKVVKRNIINRKKNGFVTDNFSYIYEISSVLYFLNSYWQGKNNNKTKSNIKKKHQINPGASLRYIKQISGIEIKQEMEEEEIINMVVNKYFGNIKNEKLIEIMNEIDNWIIDIQLTLDKKIREGEVDINNDKVENMDIKELLRLSFGNKDIRNNIINTEKENNIVAFEAQRKLILMLIFIEAYKYRDQKLKLGVEKIEGIENKLLNLKENIDKNYNFTITDTEYKGILIRNIKELYSFGRKVIERDVLDFELEGKDIFRQSLVFENDGFVNENGELDLKITNEYPIPEERFTTKDENINMPDCIYKYIKSLDEEARAGDKILKIKEWKPYTGKMKSNSAGGGGDIRLWKFYIELSWNDNYGTERTEMKEVQCFLPNNIKGKIENGEYDNNHKKNDDKKYSMNRLLMTNSIKSIIELLWPSAIYGDKIKELFTK